MKKINFDGLMLGSEIKERTNNHPTLDDNTIYHFVEKEENGKISSQASYQMTEDEKDAELIEVQKSKTLSNIQLAIALGDDEAVTRLRAEYTTLSGGTPLPTNQEIIDAVLDPYIVADIEATYLDETGGVL